MKNIKLFCIPYSGGMADVYYRRKKVLSPEIILKPVELKGHGHRIREEFYKDIKDAADDLSDLIISNVEYDEKYAILGHSLGALLAYEVYFAIKKKGVHDPIHMFFSGRKSPDEVSQKTEIYKLDDENFMKHVAFYGGSSDHIMKNPELMEIFLPILRADFRIGETYEYEPYEQKINCDISILNGNNDMSILGCNLNRWNNHTNKDCAYQSIEGNHFFIMDNIKETVFIINDTLENYL